MIVFIFNFYGLWFIFKYILDLFTQMFENEIHLLWFCFSYRIASYRIAYSTDITQCIVTVFMIRSLTETRCQLQIHISFIISRQCNQSNLSRRKKYEHQKFIG